jgi:hypothetical protein
MDLPLGMLRLVVRDGSQGGEPLTLLPPIAQLRSPQTNAFNKRGTSFRC